MRFFLLTLVVCLCLSPLSAQDSKGGPVSEKAQKSYKEGMKDLQEHREGSALDEFKKADKQDGGLCFVCQQKMIKYGLALEDWKTAELAAEEMTSEAKDARETAVAHYQFAAVLFTEGSNKHKDDYFSRAHDELGKALAAYANFPDAILLGGRALANLRQDDAAKAQFEKYLKLKPGNSPDHQRAVRYVAPRTCACPHGAALRCYDARWQSRFDGRPSGQSRPARFLGHLVRTVPRGTSACSQYGQEVSRRAFGHFECQPRWGRGKVEGFRRQE
jgi:tetratricopeptide (TPR) repeat protein